MQKSYKRRHEKACVNLHWYLQIMGSRRNGDEFDIQADKVPEHRRHNDVVGKENAIYWILENAIPGDHEDEEKEYGKKEANPLNWKSN